MMKQLVEYIKKSKDAKKVSEFPVKKDYNYTVTFIQPEINTAEGIYRTIVPSMVLNTMTTIRSFVVGMSEKNESVSINEKDYVIKESLAKISDHIVFPFVSYPLSPIIEQLKKINKDLKFSYYIDFNYYYLPDSYPHSEQYAESDFIEIIEQNIIDVDQVIVTNRELYKFLHLKLSKKEKIKGCGTSIAHQKLFIDKSLYPKIGERKKDKKGKKRFGLVLNNTHFSDLSFLKGILKEFLKNNEAKAEIVVLGWNGMYKDRNYLNNINVDFHPEVSFYEYPEKLRDMEIDCFVIPAKVNKYNATSKNYIKFLEFSRLNIPVIAPNLPCYQDLIQHNGNAVLCDTKEEWRFELEIFLKDPAKYYGLADRAYASAIDYDIRDKSNLENIMEIYEI
ncbi:MAG: hypothetical protein K9H26_18400 [Prolixibacteraceae bacterium]|nr:hypothetical protein [Prolixibacteraceae bacterium]